LFPAIKDQHTTYNPIVLRKMSNMIQKKTKEGKACSARGQDWRRKLEAKLNSYFREVFQQDHSDAEFIAAALKSFTKKHVRQREMDQATTTITSNDVACSLLCKLTYLICSTTSYLNTAQVIVLLWLRLQRWNGQTANVDAAKSKRNLAHYLRSMGSSNRPRGACRWQNAQPNDSLVSA
jgi:hypothetical protein